MRKSNKILIAVVAILLIGISTFSWYQQKNAQAEGNNNEYIPEAKGDTVIFDSSIFDTKSTEE